MCFQISTFTTDEILWNDPMYLISSTNAKLLLLLYLWPNQTQVCCSMWFFPYEVKGHVNPQNAIFSDHRVTKYRFLVCGICNSFESECVFSLKRPMQIRSARHFDCAIFSVTSRVQSLRTRNEHSPFLTF